MPIFRHFKLLGKMISLVFGGRIIKGLWQFISGFFADNKAASKGGGGSEKLDPNALNFSDVANRLGFKDKADIEGRLLELRIEFWVFFLVFMVSLLFMFFNARFGAMAVLGAASVMMLAGARIMISSYRAWNISSRKIHSFKEWFGNPDVWVP